MKRKGLFVLLFILAAGFAKAQSLDDVKKFMYYERWNSAMEAVNKIIAANPANVEALYYKGQIYIRRDEDRNIAAAKKIYQDALASSSANGNNPLLIAGMGHVELLEGKLNDARNRFETAISLSQGKNIQVLNAVGIANTTAENGDALYAVDKLKQATQVKGFKDAEIMCNLGDAYAKALDGGNAEKSYEMALSYDPNFARAKYRWGKIYQRQKQPELAFEKYNQAITTDPKYAPAYLTMYDMYSKTDLAKAEDALNKYLNNCDPDPKNCYLRSKIKYEQRDFRGAITKATECINAGGEVYNKNYGIIAYAYYRLGECQNSINAFKQYFEKSKAENIGAGDYDVYAGLLLQCGNGASDVILAGTYYEKGANADTVAKEKPSYFKKMAKYYDSLKQFENMAVWYKKALGVITNPTKSDFFNVAYNYHKAGKYQEAIENYKPYIQKFPNEESGYYLSALSEAKIDSSQKLGLAVPNYTKVVEVGDMQWATDSATVKPHYLKACQYLIGYYYNIKNDTKKALEFTNKYLSREPGDSEVLNYKKAFEAALAKPQKPAPKPPAQKPATKPGAAAKTPTAPVKKKS